MQFVRNYLKKIKSYRLIRFILESTLIALLGKFLIGFLIAGVLVFYNINIDELPEPDYLEKSTSIFFWVQLCMLGPAIETLIAQWIPLTLLQKITSNIKLIIGIDALLFTLAHGYHYGFIKIITILPIAIVLAWSFIIYNDDSFLKAFWVTTSIHALFNFSSYLPKIFFDNSF